MGKTPDDKKIIEISIPHPIIKVVKDPTAVNSKPPSSLLQVIENHTSNELETTIPPPYKVVEDCASNGLETTIPPPYKVVEDCTSNGLKTTISTTTGG